MKIDDVKKVLVLGAGTMGEQIAVQCALHGFDVAVYDIKADALEKMAANMKKVLRKLAEGGITDSAGAEAAMKRISTTTDPAEAAKGADILSESVPEDPELKAKVFSQFNGLCHPDAIFTSNTSSLVPSMFAEKSGRPARVIALHFHPPVWVATVVDVMPHPGTDPEVVEITRQFAGRIGQVPIVLQKEHPGFVFNSMLMSWIESALSLVTRGICGVEEVDRSWMGVMFAPMGPFGVMDFIGLETCYRVTDYWARKRGDKKALAAAALLKGYVDRGELGMKTKKGFYTYPDPAYSKPDFLKKGIS